MSGLEDFLRIATLFSEGFQGQPSSLARFQQQDQERAVAKSMGLSVKDMYAELARREREQQDLAMEQKRQEMAQKQQELDLKVSSGARDEANFIRDYLGKESALTAKTGLRSGEALDPLIQYTPPDGRSVQTLPGNLPAERAPGVYLNIPGQTREEYGASIDQALSDEKLAREIGMEKSLQAERVSSADTAAGRLKLDQARFEEDKREEGRRERLSNKQIERIDATLAQMRGENRQLSTAQAVSLANSLIGEDIDMEVPEDIARITQLARNLQDTYADPEGATARIRAAVRENVARRAVTPWDEEGASGGSGDDIRREFQERGEEMGRQPTEPPPQNPRMPAIQGQPYPDAMNPDISILDLLGANPDVQNKIQEFETNSDQYVYDKQIRHLMQLGVPESRWPEELIIFANALRHPEKALQSLPQ